MSKKKILKGYFRHPSLNDYIDDVFNGEVGGYVECDCGQILQTRDALYEHWKAGHFDKPIYEEIK